MLSVGLLPENLSPADSSVLQTFYPQGKTTSLKLHTMVSRQDPRAQVQSRQSGVEGDLELSEKATRL
jgi:hypothetical protein